MRPDVAAPDRFTHRLKPFGINFMNRLSNIFPPHIIAHDRIVLMQCIKCETLSNYSAGLLRFTRFCDDFAVLEATRMLASESLLSIFITAHSAGRVGKGTLLSWLSGLQLWHVINSAPWNGGACLSRAVKGAAPFTPSSSFRAPRLPVTIHHLQVLKQDLDCQGSCPSSSGGEVLVPCLEGMRRNRHGSAQ